MNYIIADITRAWAGSEASLLRAMLQLYENVESSNITIVCYQDQQNAANLVKMDFHIHSLPRGVHYTQIAENVWSLIYPEIDGLSKSDQILILSFHTEVLKLESRIEPHFKPYISFIHWSTATGGISPEKSIVSKRALWPEEVISRNEALSILTEALQNERALERSSAIRQADLRFYIGQIDNRLSKSGPLGSTPGLIKLLVESAESRQLIEVDRSTDKVNPFIWIRNAKLKSPAKDKSVQPDLISGKSKSRSQEYMDILRTRDLGPFSSIRETLYDCLESVVRKGNRKRARPITIMTTLGAAIDETIAICNNTNNKGKIDAERFPWRRVRQFLINIMIRRPVLLNEHKQIVAPSFSSVAMIVTGLKENWRNDLEGELIIALVESGIGIHLVDTPSLAGALFVSRTDKDEHRIGEIIQYLLNEKRLIESGAPHYRLEIPFSTQSPQESLPVKSEGDVPNETLLQQSII